jgi:hypothetical protein
MPWRVGLGVVGGRGSLGGVGGRVLSVGIGARAAELARASEPRPPARSAAYCLASGDGDSLAALTVLFEDGS